MMAFLLFTVIALAFVFLVIIGALSDLSTFRIPNWISYGIVGLFLVQSVAAWFLVPPDPTLYFGMSPFLVKTSIGFVVFIVSIVFWARGYIGGGDAKYLVATSLWMGPEGVVMFMVLVSGLSLLMAMFLKISRTWGFLIHAGKLPIFVKRLYAKLDENQLPFGFPIGIAALIMMPHVFTM